ncbi:hydroxyacylglutathione hydrolase [Thiomicrospira sp. WB1]|jgi:hydroxyacylglutathione hydrolase|uniref:hydroxyacylglutathione hydrolase n=1 Tax=Thiomicrospira sp. WB1 TaxID=1685380 RepID=UPI00074A15CE|nr:hydroxyacylglutathione hydrolase [Thiomicrospira sp. WB1]KUJ72961.1 hydroxyacylglutathione hydrolase [Thiomicrospira sp. WB1]
MHIHRLPTLSDNYSWVIMQADPTVSAQSQCYVVDPGEAAPILAYCETHQLNIAGILITHHHYDHVDGVRTLKGQFPQAEVIGFKQGPFGEHITHPVSEGDALNVLGERFDVLETPGHCDDHICFHHPQALFSGDLLFAGGCGKIWDHDPEKMHRSLMKIKALPGDCLVYCGHEYTYPNLMFAHIAEPDNQAITERLERVRTLRRQAQCTVPSLLCEEKVTNPFLRYLDAPLSQTLQARSPELAQAAPATYFARLRAWKDDLDATDELDKGLND